METKWAEENLQTIRSLMERSAIYRRALGPVAIFTGAMGIAAGLVGHLAKIERVGTFSLYWMAVGILVIICDMWLVRRRALRDGEEFWSPPMRRVVQAMLPPLLIGAVLGVFVAVGFWQLGSMVITMLIAFWTCLFGLALHAAGFFMMRGIRAFAFIFIVAGIGLLAMTGLKAEFVAEIPPHLKMGSIFGGLHLAYGIYLSFTEKRRDET